MIYNGIIMKLLPPNDERVLSSIAPFVEANFKELEGEKTLQEFCDDMFATMAVSYTHLRAHETR